MDLGLMTEGFVELDPMSGRMVLRIPQENGANEYLDVQDFLTSYNGRQVRFIITPVETIAKLAEMVASGEVSV